MHEPDTARAGQKPTVEWGKKGFFFILFLNGAKKGSEGDVIRLSVKMGGQWHLEAILLSSCLTPFEFKIAMSAFS